MSGLRVVIVGASGGIGKALVSLFSHTSENKVFALSRSGVRFPYDNVQCQHIDFNNEATIKTAAEVCGEIDIVIVASGFLHDATTKPEKSLRELSTEHFQKNFLINTIGPALVAKNFIPQLMRDRPSIFAALSARVGSISDNRLGGWYAYRASKAALNMFIKTVSIETARRNPRACIVGIHPGTVNTSLSEPFQKNVPEEKLFTADYAAEKIVKVLLNLGEHSSGKIFAWDGSEIGP